MEIFAIKNKWNRKRNENIAVFSSSFFFLYNSMVIAVITLAENQFVTRGNGVGVPRNSEGRKGDKNFPHRCIKIQYSVQTWRDSSELGRQWNMKLYRIQQLSECYLSWTAWIWTSFNFVHRSKTITVIIHHSHCQFLDINSYSETHQTSKRKNQYITSIICYYKKFSWKNRNS